MSVTVRVEQRSDSPRAACHGGPQLPKSHIRRVLCLNGASWRGTGHSFAQLGEKGKGLGGSGPNGSDS